MFCSIRVALSHAYSHDVMPVGYGGGRREIWNRITRILPFGAPTLKDRRATRRGEIMLLCLKAFEQIQSLLPSFLSRLFNSR